MRPDARRPSTAAMFTAVALTLFATAAFAATVSVGPIKDTTLYQGTDPASGEVFEDNSCGAGPEMFAGITADGLVRRAVLAFDIAAAVPAGSTINSVTLTTTINRSGDNQEATMTLHTLTRFWGEGVVDCSGIRGGGKGAPAAPGDATWLDAEFSINSWASAGGDFGVATATAVVPFANGSNGVWDSAVNPAMVADVQSWLDNPAGNDGWIILGDEGRVSTTRRFYTGEGNVPPTLTIDFTPTGDVYACCFTDGACSITDTTSCAANGGTSDTGTSSCTPNACPQPVGACCRADESCSDFVDRAICESGGGLFQGADSTCSDTAIDCGLTPFVDPLPVPPVLQPVGTRSDGAAQYSVEVIDATQQLHAELPGTNVWTYNGAYPSFTIEAQKGQPIEVTYINNLPQVRGNRGAHILEVDECAHGPNYWSDSARIVTHLHGGHLPARFDGQPEYTLLPGELDVYEYPNNQDAATLWYHDHALGITRLNVYAGMAGFYLLRDEYDTGAAPQPGDPTALNLPTGEFEIPLVIQDREFNADGSLFYNPTLQNAFKGDKIVVNGKVWPYLNVKQGKYRLRFLNGSQSREYSLRLEDLADPTRTIPFTMIGTDTGLTTQPIDLDTIPDFAPAERMDVIVDFSGLPAGAEIVLRNDNLATPRLPNVMKFVVTNEAGFIDPVPSTLHAVAPLDPTGVPSRRFRLTRTDAACSNDPSRIIGEWLIESLDAQGVVIGEHWDDITEFPRLGSREIWEFENPTNSMHPMHVHLVRFQVLDKVDLDGQLIPLRAWENNTWKDTVRVPPQSRVRVIMDFDDYLGKFAYHCHILDHEDHEMMRQFQTINDPANCNFDGICDPGEDCVSCADCGSVSGALCGNGLCEAGDGENCVTCPDDCAGKQKGSQSRQFCCGFDDGQVNIPIGCGIGVDDDRCISSAADLYCRDAPRVAACCGDALCEGQETEASCALDCAPGGSSCTPSEAVEVSCFDGQDNDCDVVADCGDTDCDGAIGSTTSCGLGVCANSGQQTCVGGAEVDTCSPLPAGEPGTELSCDDGLDNDCDGVADVADADCQTTVDCSQLLDRNSCRNESSCRWLNRDGVCVNR